MNILTTNPLTRQTREFARVEVAEGTRLAFNAARKGWPTLITGKVIGIGWSKRHGRLVNLRIDSGEWAGSKITGLAIDTITTKILTA
jgi:hypothetical protein